MHKKKKINLKKKLEKVYKFFYFKGISGIVTFVLAVIFGLPALLTYINQHEPIDISGEWKFTFTVEESSYQGYIDNSSTYKIYFFQKDQEITGNGESWEFNKELNYAAHRPITLNGKITKFTFLSNYMLHGDRVTYGSLELEANKKGNTMQGRFSGTGAAVKGTVIAEKL
jgi:hypothetical protein